MKNEILPGLLGFETEFLNNTAEVNQSINASSFISNILIKLGYKPIISVLRNLSFRDQCEKVDASKFQPLSFGLRYGLKSYATLQDSAGPTI